MTEIRKYSPTQVPKNIWTELNLPDEDSKIRAMVNSGFSVELLNKTARTLGLSTALVTQSLKIAGMTLSRRRKVGHFNQEESDRFFRLIEVTNRATVLFEGDQRAALHWMQTSVPALGNKKPIEMLHTSAHTLAVLKLITRLEFGVHP